MGRPGQDWATPVLLLVEKLAVFSEIRTKFTVLWFHCRRERGRNSTGGKISFNNGNNIVIKVGDNTPLMKCAACDIHMGNRNEAMQFRRWDL